MEIDESSDSLNNTTDEILDECDVDDLNGEFDSIVIENDAEVNFLALNTNI